MSKRYKVPTNEFATRFGVKGDTLRRNLCVNGHYMGIRPLKMPNQRLLWPDVQPEDVCEKLSR